MKKVLLLTALVLGMASCQKDFTADVESRGEVNVQLAVAAPELIGATRTDGDAQNTLNSAYGAIDYLDGNATGDRQNWDKVDLRYSLEVYDKDDLTTPVKDRMVIIKDKYEPVKFDLRLIPNRDYQFVIFADFVPQGTAANAVDYANQAELGLRHTIGANLTEITIKQGDDALNDEIADSYFKTFEFRPENNTSNSINDVVLQRPYAKVRVIATDLAELNLNVEPKYVSVDYGTTPILTAFNAVTGEISVDKLSSDKAFEYTYVEDIRSNRANHVYNADYDAKVATAKNGIERASHLTLFTDYILAKEATQSPISFQMTVYDENREPIKTVDFNTNIPVQRNHLTTIIGNVLTAATEVTVTIDDNFANANEDEIEERPFYQVAVSTGFEFVKAYYEDREIILQGHITVTQEDVDAYLATRAAAAINPIVNLNGYVLTFVNDGADALLTVAEGSSLTIEDNVGTGAVVLEGNGVAIENNGELNVVDTTIEAQGEGSVIENNGEANIEGSTLNEGALANNGEANIVDSTLNAGSVENNGTANLNGSEVADDAVENGENATVGTYVYTAEELQAAINAAVATDATNEIRLAADIEGNVTVVEKKDVKLVINGCGYKYDGTIKVHSNSNHYATAALTVKNVNFETATPSINFIEALENGSERYSTNITAEACTFTATGEAVDTVVGLQIKSSKNAKVIGCTATNMHSLIQAQSCDETVVVKGCTINGKNGVAFKQVKAATVENTTIVAKEYGIRFDGNIDNYGIVVKGNNINAKQPFIVRKMTGKNNSIAIEGENTFTTTESYQFVITNGSDDEAYVIPTGTYTLTGAEKYMYYPKPLAKVGTTEYIDIDEAIAAWAHNTTLTLMSDVTLNDVITLKSTEYHILDLGTYTLTAAKGKDAISISNEGRTSASYALDIKADATNPGGITATSKAVVKTTGKSGVKDRPIIRFYNGVFNATNVISHSGSNGTNCPQFQFHNGVYNASLSANRALIQIYGGTFNGKFYISVDSSAYALISGGKFKYLDNLYGSALNTDKFTIGSAKGVLDRGIYVDNEGYFVVGGAVITEFGDMFEAKATNASKAGSYLPYSSAAEYGLYYTNAAAAIAKHGEANVVLK